MKDRKLWLTSASQSPIRGRQTAARHRGSWRIPVPPIVMFLCAPAFMLAYEFLKESWAPQLTKWESHVVTIVVSSIIATVLSCFVMRRMRDSEAKYRNLFESSRDAMMTVEPPSWKFTAGNPAMQEMFRLKNAR